MQVMARGGLMCGVVSEKYLGAACPDTIKPDEDLDDVAQAIDAINDYGGWAKVQQLLRVVKVGVGGTVFWVKGGTVLGVRGAILGVGGTVLGGVDSRMHVSWRLFRGAAHIFCLLMFRVCPLR